MNEKTIIIIGVSARSLVNFRGELIRLFIHMGHKVLAVASGANDDDINEIESLGAHYVEAPSERTGTNVFVDLKTMNFYRKLFYEIRPEYVISYTIKPVIWSGIALASNNYTNFTALITGLGYSFQGLSLKRKVIRIIVSFLYKLSLKRADQVIFQNNEDLTYFVEKKIVSNLKVNTIPGSGVPIHHFAQKPLRTPPIIFLMISRLLKEKGIYQFFEAARQVKMRFPEARFQLLGGLDQSPDGINQRQLNELSNLDYVEYLGETQDVRPYIENCHVFVLPSYYREGLPRTILEAMSVGRAVLTTDHSGCRDAIVEGCNGWLVPVQDSNALVEKMVWFIENPNKTELMGLASRQIIKERFDVRKVNDKILEIIRLH